MTGIRKLRILLMLGACGSTGYAQFFGPPVSYYLGGSSIPSSVVICDLDGDGFVDAAISESGYDRVSIFYNNQIGFGDFETPASVVDVGDMPMALSCVDIDGDSDKDIIVANFNAGTLTLINNTSFRTYGTSTISIASGLSGVVACDVNSDQLTDLITVNDVAGLDDTVSILLGTGGGTFAIPTTILSGGTSSRTVVCAKLDSGEALDLAVANQFTDDVSVILGNGDGTFQAPQTHPAGDGPTVISACDVDLDDDLDVLVSLVYGGGVALLRNNGAGFDPSEHLGSGTISNTGGIVCVDIDLDGDVDIGGSGSVSGGNGFVLLNVGAGVFSTPQSFSFGGFGAGRVSAGLLNNDCLPDLAGSTGAGNQLAVVINSDVGVNFDLVSIPKPGVYTSQIIAINANNDLNAELVVVDSGPPNFPGAFFVYPNLGAGTFGSPVEYPIVAGYADRIASGDFDHDADMDICVTTRDDEELLIFINDGAGNFVNSQTLGIGGTSASEQVTGLALCDVDDDGYVDVVASYAQGPYTVAIAQNDGSGTFEQYVNISGGEASGVGVACLDLNQDNLPDVATAESHFIVHFNNGLGGFVELGIPIGGNSRFFLTCDVNGDYLHDLVTCADSGVFVATNLGNGAFSSSYSILSGSCNTIESCDLDADGDRDFIVGRGPSNPTILRNNGTGQFQATSYASLSGAYYAFLCYDLNSDHVVDLITSTPDDMIGIRTSTGEPKVMIVSQPDSQTVLVGGTATLQVVVDSPEAVDYQWYKNGAAISGANTSTYQIGSAQIVNEGSYVVKCTSGCISLASDEAVLQVLTLPIPAIGVWGLIATGSLLLIAAAGILRKRATHTMV